MVEPSADEVSAVIESMAVGYVTLNRSWQITFVNAAAEPVLGRPAAELVGQDLWEMFPGARELAFGRVYEDVMQNRRPASFEAFYPGLAVWFELRVQPAEDGIAVYFLDVTAQHDARAEADAARARLALLAQVSETLAGADDPDVAVGQLAALVVPELADWSVVTVIDELGLFRDVGWAHRDPTRETDVAAYGAIQSASMTDDSPVATSLRTGQPVFVPYLSDEALLEALHDPVAIDIARRLEPHGVAILPLTARGHTLGMLALVTTRARGPHTSEEIAMAREVARRAGPVLDSARSAEQSRRLAESIQLSLLEIGQPARGITIGTRYRPAHGDRQVGGDWFDSFTLPDGSTTIAIGDVIGHDTAAIAAMAQLRTMMRTTAWILGHSPAEVLAATDDASFGLGPATFATAMTADIRPAADDGSVQMRWSNAGHPSPAVLAPDGTVAFLRTDVIDLPLGVQRGTARHDHSVTLAKGSIVLLYTDGLIERRTRDIDTGMTELAAALARYAGSGVDAILDGLLDDFTRGEHRTDDIALLALHIADDPT